VGGYVVEPAEAAHLALLKSAAFDPLRQAALYDDPHIPQTPSANQSTGAATSRAHVDTERDNSLSLTVSAPAAGLLVVSQTYAPGWHATVDGRVTAVLPADGALQAVPVAAGTHQVFLWYLPDSVRQGAAVTLTTALALAVWAMTTRIRHHRHRGIYPPALGVAGA